MKDLLSVVGRGIFWLLWPVWYVYFKIQPKRSRVLVIVQDEVLLLREWISTDRFSMPGGGTKRSESTLQSATRELHEKTGINTPESALQLLGKRRSRHNGFNFLGIYYVLRLDAKPVLHLRKLEITEALWIPLEKAYELPVSNELSYALKKYRPATQESLL